MFEYKVAPFKAQVAGCGAADMGWDAGRCAQFEQFLNDHAAQGWELYSHEYRAIKAAGCGVATDSHTLICIFRKTRG